MSCLADELGTPFLLGYDRGPAGNWLASSGTWIQEDGTQVLAWDDGSTGGPSGLPDGGIDAIQLLAPVR